MGSFPGTCEIEEAKEELESVPRSRRTYRPNSGVSVWEKDQKPPVLKLKCKESLEDDINQLFEAISLKPSSKGFGRSPEIGTSSIRRNALKKPITVGIPRSPGIGNSEPVSLKQALRDLCISKASEMAAVKRLSKSTGSPGPSEAGRIKSLYNAVVVEDDKSFLSTNEGKGSMVEISLVPEESRSNSSEKMSRRFQVLKMKSSGESAHSSRYAVATTQNGTGTTSKQNEILSASTHLQVPILQMSSKSAPSTPRYAMATTQNGSGMTPLQNEFVSAATKVGTRTIKMELAEKEKRTPERSPSPPSCSNIEGEMLELDKALPVSTKLENKASTQKPGRKGRLHSLTSSSSSTNGNGLSKLKRHNPCLVKPVLRNKSFVKRKSKQDSTSAASTFDEYSEVEKDIGPGSSQLVCQRCQCALKNERNESDQDPPASHSASVDADVSLGNVNYGASKPDFTPNKYDKNKAVGVKAKKNSKVRENGEFSQSSKSSLGEYSSSSSISSESNVSGSSCGNRPHMSKDVRWEAIRNVRVQHGVLGLRHFNLLKKLGCGDIGTVYLAELIGSNCLFAIKVMDNDFLARRKKMPRAQTEREILRMLDHPFLPTLYTQFTSDNLLCLVMEYCPGGDLHVLRQKQLGRSFPEPAARFYVAEVLLALEYLHMLGVVYRDLKPENILVREDGHIMLTDFDLSLRCTVSPTLLKSSPADPLPVRISGPGTKSNCIEPFCIEPSCQVPCFSPRFLPNAAKTRKLKAEHAAQVRSLPQLVAEPTDARSNSFVGTHEYLAPEIIKGEGHGAAVDWWTFGIFLYELLYGRTPFKGCGNEETLANVVLQSLQFPDSPIVSFQARDLIRGLLVKEPENRLGTEKGAAEIKQHPFFEGLNWALIRCAVPPELPDFYEYGVPNMASQEKKIKFLECKSTGEHLEFELF